MLTLQVRTVAIAKLRWWICASKTQSAHGFVAVGTSFQQRNAQRGFPSCFPPLQNPGIVSNASTARSTSLVITHHTYVQAYFYDHIAHELSSISARTQR